ncbi:hypothetical protein RJ640_009517 [Escallonia rubra]|uniref:NmrA-like domain-containing protein n=1 Tax=Escallonia rubra TaxID=112253 RepID=A0AA88R679_9ASTE|nr:hypothetical protein RJ640_009517 [Escallonia rubra]
MGSKILIVGGSGYLGTYMVKASIAMGHPTYVYARPITPETSPSRIESRKEIQSLGATLLQGELDEQEKLVLAIKQVDIVISTLAIPQALEQLKIIDAIKVAGNIKRFIPSDFGVDEDKATALHPFQACLDKKKIVRRAIEAAEIPHTFVASICLGGYFLNHLFPVHDKSQEITVYGTGEAKAVLALEEDVAAYTVRVANDPRTSNRMVFYRPAGAIVSQLELISLWESKTNQVAKRVHLSAEELVKLAETSPHPHNVRACIIYSIFVKGDTVNFELEENDVEIGNLYPDFKVTTTDQLLDRWLSDPPKLEYTDL